MAESEFADHQTSRTAPGTSAAECTLSTVRCWPAKLAEAPSSSTAEERTAKGGGSSAMACASFSMALSSSDGDGLDQVARQRHARRHRQAVARGLAQAHGLGAVERGLARLGEGDDLLHPQHRHFAGVAVDAHAHAVGDALGGLARADDAGNAVFARHDRRMRQQPAVVGDDAAEQRQQDVEGLGGGLGDEHVALG